MVVKAEWLALPDVLARAPPTLDRARQPRLYDRLDWFALTVAHGLAAAPVALHVGEGEDEAWLFLDRQRRAAGPLGSWYTLAYRPIATDPRLLAPLFGAAARRLSRLALHPVDDADVAQLIDALRASGWMPFVTQISTNQRVAIGGGGFAAYWRGRPSMLRNTVRRAQRSHPLDTIVHRAFDADGWAAYADVYAASWKPAEGSLAFLRALAEREGVAGTLRLGIARAADGRAVAAQLWLVENGTATIHKIAHREDARSGSPGSLLSQTMFAHAIDEDRVDAIDFGLGDEPYKASWTDRVRPVWRIDAYRPARLTGIVGIAREIGGRLARRLGKR